MEESTLMAWNPSPEVAVVRDAANKLKTPFAVLVYIDPTAQTIHTASYGQNRQLCAHAGEFAKHLLAAAMKWGENEPDPQPASKAKE